jgi:serine/threonine protein kinase
MKRVVALKVLTTSANRPADAVQRFRREVEAAAKLSHPNIVAAYDADEVRGIHFLVMEYIEGTDLGHWIKKHGPLSADRAIDCILQAARGLEHAHAMGVVHRDVKPGNLLLDKSGTVKILDMGLARFDDQLSTPGSASELTRNDRIMGSVDFMSPEQALNTKHADQRADIYSLGCSLFYLLTGRLIYPGETVMETLLAHRQNPIPPLAPDVPNVPPALEAVFSKMVAKRKEQRYQSMQEVIAALEACQSAEATQAAAAFVCTADIIDDSQWMSFLRATEKGETSASLAEFTSVRTRSRPLRSAVRAGAKSPPLAVRIGIASVAAVATVLAITWLAGSLRQSQPTSEAIAATGGLPPGVSPRVETDVPVEEPGPTTPPFPEAPPATATPTPPTISVPLAAVGNVSLPVQPLPAPPASVPDSPMPSAKAPLPSDADLQPAEMSFEAAYGADLRDAKTAAQKVALGQRLLHLARTLRADLPASFVMLRNARDLAVAAGDPETALQAVDELALTFQIESLRMKAEMLAAISKLARTMPRQKELATKSLRLLDEALRADDYAAAKMCGEAARTAARSAKDAALIKQSTTRLKDVEQIVPEFEVIRESLAVLEQNPADAVANRRVGRFRCFIKQDWAGGLRLLELGDDKHLSELAARDLSEPSSATALGEIGDGWWDLADKEKGLARQNLLARAGDRYFQALAESSGLAKIRLEKRLKEIDFDPAKARAAFGRPLFDGKTLRNWFVPDPNLPMSWSTGDGELLCGTQPHGQSLYSNEKFQDFELHLEFWLPAGTNTGVFLRGRYEVQLIDSPRKGLFNGSCGAIWGQLVPSKQAYIGPERWNSLDVKLVNKIVTVIVNGERIVDGQAITGPTEGAIDGLESDPGPLVLQYSPKGPKFRDIRIRPLNLKR